MDVRCGCRRQEHLSVREHDLSIFHNINKTKEGNSTRVPVRSRACLCGTNALGRLTSEVERAESRENERERARESAENSSRKEMNLSDFRGITGYKTAQRPVRNYIIRYKAMLAYDPAACGRSLSMISCVRRVYSCSPVSLLLPFPRATGRWVWGGV